MVHNPTNLPNSLCCELESIEAILYDIFFNNAMMQKLTFVGLCGPVLASFAIKCNFIAPTCSALMCVRKGRKRGRSLASDGIIKLLF